MASAKFLPNSDVEVIEPDLGAGTSHTTKTEDLIDSLGDFGEDATIAVYRQRGSGKEAMTFLDEFPTDKFTLSELLAYLRDSYGTGDYRLMVRAGGRLRANRLVSVEAKGQGAQSGNGVEGVLSLVLSKMEQQNQKLLEAMTRSPAPVANEDQFLERMLKYKQLFGGESSGLGGVREALGFIKDLGLNVQPPGEEREKSIFDVIEKFAPVVAQLSQAHQEQAMQAQRRAALSIAQPFREPAPAAQPVTHETTSQSPIEESQLIAIRLGVGMLLNAAKKDAPPEVYAPMLIDQLDERAVTDYVIAPDAWQKLLSVAPECEPFKAWFDSLIEHVKAMLGMESSVGHLYEDLTGDESNGNS